MKQITILWFLGLVVQFSAFGQNIKPSPQLIQKLKSARLINEEEILKALKIQRKPASSPPSFKLANPYMPRTVKKLDAQDQADEVNGVKNYKEWGMGKVKFFHQPRVHNWNNRQEEHVRNAEVCGIKFVDNAKIKYVLESFSNPESALAEGYLITHQYHCGACSSLQDLAVYLEKPNLTEPARRCSKKFEIHSIKECYEKEIGFTAACSESWAYASQNTRKTCLNECIQDYGLGNIISGKFPNEATNPDGTLRHCILCDELRSVPGYRYSAGRTRRGSGIVSEIPRDPREMYFVDYKQYYNEFRLELPK